MKSHILHRKVFISGHRNISTKEFDEHYKSKIDHFILWAKWSESYLDGPKMLTFYIGDCEGCDKMAIYYIISKLCHNIKLVICSLKESFEGQIDYTLCANDNITVIKDFNTHEERDTYMTVNTNYDILWIRQNEWSSGTAQNFVRRNWLAFEEE